MKRIAMVVDDVAFPGEKGLGRMYYLAEYLCKNGFSVNIITGKYQHWEKRHRSAEYMDRVFGQAEITFVDEPAYRKNIDIRRLFSYRVMTSNVISYMETQKYDLVYCQIPDNRLAYEAGRYASSRGIPFVVDIEDLWPEAMEMIMPVGGIGRVLLYPFARYAKKTYELADAVVGSSDTYRDEPEKYNVHIDKRLTVYAGNDLAAFDRGVLTHSDEIEKPEDEFWVTYAGTFGKSYDLVTLICASQLIPGVRIMLLGDGPGRAELEALADEKKAPVSFLGYQPYDVMAAYLKKSDILINSLIRKAPQSITSKTGDYLAAGRPMINTGKDREFYQKVESDGFGINVESENARALAEGILYLKNDPERCRIMGKKARLTAEKEFDRDKTYRNIADLLRDFL